MKNSLVDFDLPYSFHEKMEKFCTLLLNYNKTHNISGVKTKSDVIENIIDSIYPIKYFNQSYRSAIDIGSGAGFPGLLLAMAIEDCEFTLFEPIAKKSSFLHLAKIELGLNNVIIETQRLEKSTKKLVDLIVSRAVGEIEFLLNISHGFYNEDTTFLLYKGEKAKQESKNIKNVKIYTREKRRYVFIKEKNDY